MTQIKDIFDDYKGANIGTKICIELEVAKQDAEKMTEKFSVHRHMESSKIAEITGVHRLPEKARRYVYTAMKKIYTDTFPVGQDTYASGGAHFHAFFKEGVGVKELRNLKIKLNTINYSENFLSLPLFAKVKDFKFFHRRGQEILNSYNSNRNLIETMMGSRYPTGGIRSELRTHCQDFRDYVSIEFRCNNILDTRIYGYYIGQLLLAEEGIRLEKLSKGISHIPETSADKTYFHVDEISGTVYDSEDDQTKIKTNLQIMLAVLRKNGFVQAAKQLKSYAKQYAIL